VSSLANEDEVSYTYFRSFMTTIDADFLGFSKQVIKSWQRMNAKFYREIYQRQESSMKVLTTESMRHQTVPAKETNNYCHLWINWFIGEIQQIKLKLEKRRAYALKDIAVNYSAIMMVDELLKIHPEENFYETLLTIFLRNEGRNTKLFASTKTASKQLLMPVSFIENKMLLNSLNSKLLYILRDLMMPDKFILDGADINPTIDESLTKDKKM
jgi:hypothetical protein